ncbi:MAG TPA: Poxvirus G6 [Gammaproteobacteria bacterium]|nr:Poxvirus G6 [Gammaproteobacteria bacterium]
MIKITALLISLIVPTSLIPTAVFADEVLSQQITQDIEAYQRLVEQSLAYRAETLRVYEYLKKNLDADRPLSGKDIETLNDGMKKHLALRKNFLQVVHYYKYLLDDKNSSTDNETRLKGIMLSLSAALVLYDNYLLAISIFEEDTQLRRYLNSKHDGYGIESSQLTSVTLEYNSLENREKARQAIKYFREQWPEQSERFKKQSENAYLHTLITQSASYNSTLNFSPLYVINRHLKFLTGVSGDTLSELGSDGINLFSLLFGNSVGSIQTRNGRLYNNKKIEKNIHQQLKAGDILLEKTPFRLTDKLIPGYWGHVAIWTGSKEELKALGIWNHPVVKKYHDEIDSSHHVIEALRSGVEINPLESFLNIDDIAVLRKKNISDKERAKTIVRALRQIGKAYDFNFDIETNDKIVCSELVYVSYTDTQWPTDATLGRYTISPTHVAEKAGKNLPFQIVSLYLDGKPVKKDISTTFQGLNE